MTKRLVRRQQANDDVDAAAEHYLSVGDETLALAFAEVLFAALRLIADNPALGSLRYGEQLGIVGLRHWPLKRFPYLVIYVDQPDHLDVWRILHAARDIPGSLQDFE